MASIYNDSEIDSIYNFSIPSLAESIYNYADAPLLPLDEPNPNPYDTKSNLIKAGTFKKLGLGLGIGGTLVNAYNTYQANKEYNRIQEQNRKAAIKNYLEATKSINNRYAEEMEASAITQQEIQRKNMQAQATAKASSASSGVSGNSLTDLYRDYDRATAVSKYVAARNLHLKGLQLGEEIQALRAKAINEINSNSMSYQSSMAGSLLGGLGKVLSIYADTDYKNERLLKGI